MSEECWLPISGSVYEVSSLGRVRNRQGRVLKVQFNAYGYLRITLRRFDADKHWPVHRLVCEAFHGDPPSDRHHAHHIDTDKTNNRATNLCWLTAEENFAMRTFAHGSAHHRSILTEEQVCAIRAAPYERGRDARLADEFGVCRRHITSVRHGQGWPHVCVSPQIERGST